MSRPVLTRRDVARKGKDTQREHRPALARPPCPPYRRNVTAGRGRPHGPARCVIACAVAAPVALCACASVPPSQGPRAAGTAPAVTGSSSTSGTSSPVTSSASVTPSLAPSPEKSPAVAPPPTVSPSRSAAARSCAAQALAGLSASRRAAQLLLVGVDATRSAAAGPGLARLGVGGVFLHGRVAGGASLADSLALLQRVARRAGTPTLFVAADEEGGAVQTVRGGTIPPFPTALVQGTWSVPQLRERTASWTRALARLGVNLDLAPVADVVSSSLGHRNPPIGRYDREYGHTPERVSGRVATVVTSLRAAGVGPTVKHFPGLGRVLVNTDTGTGATDPVMTSADSYLQPFTAGMKAGAVAVMVSSALYPRLDRRHPAMWSRAIVTNLLRTKLGWSGMVVSDDLGTAAAARALPVGRRAVDFVAAGGDLVLTVKASQATTMRNAIVARAASDRTFRARVADAVTHVLAAKQALGLLHC
jgi:beta-N-acetylhexosaminidase